jgi:hypothetical protein
VHFVIISSSRELPFGYKKRFCLRTEMQLARAGSSGLASSTVALKLKCAFGSSGLERMGLDSGGLEMINCIWRRLERTGFESKKLEASKAIWLERARAD